jgi:hypothetical protein
LAFENDDKRVVQRLETLIKRFLKFGVGKRLQNCVRALFTRLFKELMRYGCAYQRFPWTFANAIAKRRKLAPV